MVNLVTICCTHFGEKRRYNEIIFLINGSLKKLNIYLSTHSMILPAKKILFCERISFLNFFFLLESPLQLPLEKILLLAKFSVENS